jgi:hypothetical protein
LLKSDKGQEPTDWSTDGRFILFNQYEQKTGGDIWVLPLFGDGKPYALLNSEFEETTAVFPPMFIGSPTLQMNREELKFISRPFLKPAASGLYRMAEADSLIGALMVKSCFISRLIKD